MLHLAIHNNKKFNNYQNKQNQDIKKEIHKKEKKLTLIVQVAAKVAMGV